MPVTDVDVTRFRQMLKVRAWPEWPIADLKLYRLGCTDDQLKEIRKGVEAVVMDGAYGTFDSDVAWHIQQVLCVLLHQGYEMLSVLDQRATSPHVARSRFDGAQVVSLRRDLVAVAE